jgi:hypothetical protein
MDKNLAGSETLLYTATGCPAGVSVEHMKIVDGGHVPSFNYSEAPQTIIAFFKRHIKA